MTRRLWLLAALWSTAATLFAVWTWFAATAMCDDSPTGLHCPCWSQDARDCCFCTFHDGPHALL